MGPAGSEARFGTEIDEALRQLPRAYRRGHSAAGLRKQFVAMVREYPEDLETALHNRRFDPAAMIPPGTLARQDSEGPTDEPEPEPEPESLDQTSARTEISIENAWGPLATAFSLAGDP